MKKPPPPFLSLFIPKARGLGAYLKKKALDPADTYLRQVLAAR